MGADGRAGFPSQSQGWILNGFFKFVVRGNVVGLAVGVVIGAAFSAVVSSFVNAFMTPLISVMTSSAGQFATMQFKVGKTIFPYGTFVNAIISFLLVAVVVYFLIVLPINKITEELNPYHDPSKAKRVCPECLSSIPAKAKRCSFCGSEVEPITDEFSEALIEETPGAISIEDSKPEIKFTMPSSVKPEEQPPVG